MRSRGISFGITIDAVSQTGLSGGCGIEFKPVGGGGDWAVSLIIFVSYNIWFFTANDNFMMIIDNILIMIGWYQFPSKFFTAFS